MFRIISLLLGASLTLLIASCGGDSTAEKVSKTTTYVNMPVNTELTVTLVDSIDTDVHVTGAEFRAKLSQPIIVDGRTLFASGTNAKGILDKVVESGHLKTPAELKFSLSAIQDQNGQWVNISTVMIELKNASHTNNEVAMIGGGAIVGGIIGKIVNKDGSTVIGAIAGAAAGTGLALATGKQDIFLGVGTEVTFYSSKAVQIALQ